jgi:hypothetical protein
VAASEEKAGVLSGVGVQLVDDRDREVEREPEEAPAIGGDLGPGGRSVKVASVGPGSRSPKRERPRGVFALAGGASSGSGTTRAAATTTSPTTSVVSCG